MEKTPIPEIQGAFVIEICRFPDNRGFFQEMFSKSNYSPDFTEVAQTNLSYSRKNVVRGLHVAPYAKLCTCIKGRLLDVVADVRKESPTFGNWFGVWLTDMNRKQLLVPAGCAHGFLSAEDDTILCYHQSGNYDPKSEFEIHFQDPDLNILWPKLDEYVLSNKDKNANSFRKFLSHGYDYVI